MAIEGLEAPRAVVCQNRELQQLAWHLQVMPHGNQPDPVSHFGDPRLPKPTTTAVGVASASHAARKSAWHWLPRILAVHASQDQAGLRAERLACATPTAASGDVNESPDALVHTSALGPR